MQEYLHSKAGNTCLYEMLCDRGLARQDSGRLAPPLRLMLIELNLSVVSGTPTDVACCPSFGKRNNVSGNRSII